MIAHNPTRDAPPAPLPAASPAARPGGPLRRVILRGADIVMADRVVSGGALVIEGERIADVLFAVPPLGGETVRWATGLVVPGFVDLHSDALEKEIRPRPAATMPVALALAEMDRKLAGHGITTILHALAFTEEDGPRHHAVSEGVAATLRGVRDHLLVRNLLHARYEITDVGAAGPVLGLLAGGDVRMVSFTDHTPGRGQFRQPADFIRYWSRTYGFSQERAERLACAKLYRKMAEPVAVWETLVRVAEAARGRGAVLASHDDDSSDRVGLALSLGVSVAEFPLARDAVAAARDAGLHVVMGAPNALLGGSTSGHVAALDVLRMGALDCLCSDYYPAALLHAALYLHAEGHLDLPRAFRLITLHPARALGLEGTLGSIKPGKLADLVIIGHRGGVPAVTGTLREGREVYATEGPAATPGQAIF